MFFANSKNALGLMTMAAPLILIGTICTISTVFFNISGVQSTQTINGHSYLTCTNVHYLQVLNGVCSRGRVDKIDVKNSCIEWSDYSTWKAMDAKNDAAASAGLTGFIHTKLEHDAKYLWPNIKNVCITSIPFAIINAVACLVATDLDSEDFSKKHGVDPDFVTLIISSACNILIFITFCVVAIQSQNSYFADSGAWRTNDCRYVVGPSFGYFLLILGGVFSLISLLGSLLTLFSKYVLHISPDNELDLNKVQPLEDGDLLERNSPHDGSLSASFSSEGQRFGDSKAIPTHETLDPIMESWDVRHSDIDSDVDPAEFDLENELDVYRNPTATSTSQANI